MLNCDNQVNQVEKIEYNMNADKKICILENIDLSTEEINSSRNLSLALIFTYDLMHESINKLLQIEQRKELWNHTP